MIDHEPIKISANIIIDRKTGVKYDMTEWLKKYNEEEKIRKSKIDNNPNAQILYSYEINVDTLGTIAGAEKVLDYPENATGFASYEESGDGRRVYAESLVSAYDARTLVYEFCKKFTYCAEKIFAEAVY